jgi:hypothetical protein
MISAKTGHSGNRCPVLLQYWEKMLILAGNTAQNGVL